MISLLTAENLTIVFGAALALCILISLLDFSQSLIKLGDKTQ